MYEDSYDADDRQMQDRLTELTVAGSIASIRKLARMTSRSLAEQRDILVAAKATARALEAHDRVVGLFEIVEDECTKLAVDLATPPDDEGMNTDEGTNDDND
jgi:hypothetical protein